MPYQRREQARRIVGWTEETTSSRSVISTTQKEQLIHLNNRLAAYIDNARSLKLDNGGLTDCITFIEDTLNLKIVETAEENAGLQIENEMCNEELDGLRPRVKKLEKELNSANNRISVLEASVAEKDGRIRALSNENSNLEDQLNELRKELEKKEKQLLDAKTQVKEEKVKRVALENRLKSLKEELALKEQFYKEELKKYTDVSGDTNWVDILQELRDQYDECVSRVHTETEELYSIEINELKTKADKYKEEHTRCQDKLRDLKNDKHLEILTLKNQIDIHVTRIEDLREQIRVEKDRHSEASENHSKAMAKQQEWCKKLININQSLDAEITTYRKLLEDEEARLDLTQSPQKETPNRQKQKAPEGRQKRATKRRRVEGARDVYSPTGVVDIKDSDPEGKYIKLHNTSESDQPLGGWVIKRSVDNGPEKTYKFTSKFVLNGGAEVTVWSSGSGASRDPPKDLVSRNDDWGKGEQIDTTLVDASGRVRATRNLNRRSVGVRRCLQWKRR